MSKSATMSSKTATCRTSVVSAAATVIMPTSVATVYISMVHVSAPVPTVCISAPGISTIYKCTTPISPAIARA